MLEIFSSEAENVNKKKSQKIVPSNHAETNAQPYSLDATNATAIGGVAFTTGGTVAGTSNCCSLI